MPPGGKDTCVKIRHDDSLIFVRPNTHVRSEEDSFFFPDMYHEPYPLSEDTGRSIARGQQPSISSQQNDKARSTRTITGISMPRPLIANAFCCAIERAGDFLVLALILYSLE